MLKYGQMGNETGWFDTTKNTWMPTSEWAMAKRGNQKGIVNASSGKFVMIPATEVPPASTAPAAKPKAASTGLRPMMDAQGHLSGFVDPSSRESFSNKEIRQGKAGDRIGSKTAWKKVSSGAREYLGSEAGDVALRTGGAMVGGALAAPFNLVAPGVSEVAGMALGDLAGGQLSRMARQGTGQAPAPRNVRESLSPVAKDVPGALASALLGPGLEAGGRAVGRAAKEVVPGVVGAITGQGRAVPEAALAAGKKMASLPKGAPKPAFTKAMRTPNRASAEREAVNTAREAVSNLSKKASDEYAKDFEALYAKQGTTIDSAPIKDKALKEYGKMFHVSKNTGKLFTGLSKDDQEIVNTAKILVDNWEDWDPVGVDSLKRQLDNIYSPNKASRAYVTALKKEVKSAMVNTVPEYAQMTSKYHTSKGLLEEIDKTLAVGGKKAPAAVISKLTSALKDEGIKSDLAEVLSRESGGELMDTLLGLQANKVKPHGWGPASYAGGGFAVAKLLSPKLYPILAAASPRASSEFLQAYGRALGELSKAGKYVPAKAARTASVAASEGAQQVMSPVRRQFGNDEDNQ